MNGKAGWIIVSGLIVTVLGYFVTSNVGKVADLERRYSETERWRGHVDARLENMGRTLDRIEDKLAEAAREERQARARSRNAEVEP